MDNFKKEIKGIYEGIKKEMINKKGYTVNGEINAAKGIETIEFLESRVEDYWTRLTILRTMYLSCDFLVVLKDDTTHSICRFKDNLSHYRLAAMYMPSHARVAA